MPEQIHIGVYGEVNANLIDGSSVWLQSICLTLATIPNVRVTLLLRAPVERDLLTRPLIESPAIDLVEPDRWVSSAMLDADAATEALTDLDAVDHFDFLVLRGAGIAERASASGRFDERLWLYHVPTADSDPAAIGRYGANAHRVLCQTPEIERHIREVAPALADRLLLLPPMVPLADADPEPEPADGPVERLVYAGKISPEYYFFEMVELLGMLRERLPGVELHVAGDKIHNPPEDPTFRERAEAALRETDGLVWHGAIGREQIATLIASADIALSIRHPSLDGSVEMSTKVLEYGAAGLPVVLNATPFHLSKLGEDYPLAVSGVSEARDAIVEASANAALRREAAGRVRELSFDHTFERTAERLRPHLEREVSPAASGEGAGVRLVVAGHNLAFAEPLLDRMRESGVALREDAWQGHSGGDETATAEAVEWATTLLCEWCLGNAVWYSRNKRPGQRLVVRFHRMELETSFPGEVDLDRVDAMVFVAEHVKEAACAAFGWPPDAPQLTVIPNAVDLEELALPKLPGAEFNLGLIGYVPRIKRLDRAIEILERLRIKDDRYRLIVKGRGPWEYPWMSTREEERVYYEELFSRIDRSPNLRQAVVFEPFGEDIPKFLQQVGWIVSTSEIEGHSVALAEGMASGSVPVVFDRLGAEAQYGERWVHQSPDAAAEAILACSEAEAIGADSRAAAEFARRWSWERIGPEWDRLLFGAG